MRSGRRARCLLLAVGVIAACTPRVATPYRDPQELAASLPINGHALTLHIAQGLPDKQNEVLVYATGDGGWRGKDRDVFRQLRSWGYAVVGFSAPDYLKVLPDDTGMTTPSRVAADFSSIIETGRRTLHLSDTVPVVLVGVSRGADLAVVAAGQPSLQPSLAGVIAMGLTREEEYVRRRRANVALALYDYLPRLGDLPLTVIQSTRDNYLPADAARRLFGADTPVRRFEAIEARNHSFAGARRQLYATLLASLRWLDLARKRPVR